MGNRRRRGAVTASASTGDGGGGSGTEYMRNRERKRERERETWVLDGPVRLTEIDSQPIFLPIKCTAYIAYNV